MIVIRFKYDKEIRTNGENDKIKQSSCAEAVSAFIWGRFVAGSKVESKAEKFLTEAKPPSLLSVSNKY